MVTITDSICLTVVNSESILMGMGNRLRLYYTKDGITLSKELEEQLKTNIHGIHLWTRNNIEHDIVVFGGRELMIASLVDYNLNYITRFVINDWINNIRLYSQDEEDTSEFCLLTSHSVALRLKIDLKTKQYNIMEKSSCTDKSTLYSSYILGDSWMESVIFGGTALGELIIWRPTNVLMSDVIYRISCHNGVIFSIECSLMYNLLVTTSDDRSVRYWKINSDGNQSTFSIKLIKALYGHTARVFRCKIITKDNQPFIISIGEDSSLCLWDLNGKLLIRKQQIDGCCLWNLDYEPIHKIIYTCSNNDVKGMDILMFNDDDEDDVDDETAPDDDNVKDEYLLLYGNGIQILKKNCN